MTEQSEIEPLVTFALFAYNQEKLIGDAMNAALAQDYDHLEIIVSDDCSTDGTWEVMQAVAKGYRGPHHLRLVRNEANMGIGPHVSNVGMLAQGELVVVAAGDDFSVPERVSRLVDAWLVHGRPDGALHSAALVRGPGGDSVSKSAGAIPENATMDYFVKNHFVALLMGAAAAYTKSVFSKFPPLLAPFEDIALTFRSLMIGKVIYVDAVLVHYHFTDSSVSRSLRFRDRERVRRWFDTIFKNLEGMESDYRSHLLSTGSTPDESITKEFQCSKRRVKRIRGLGENHPVRFIVAMLSYPRILPFRRWVGFYLGFFGIR